MTVFEIAELANRLRQQQINTNDYAGFSVSDGIRWINDFLDSLGTKAKSFGTHTVTATDTQWHSLPAECISVDEVVDDSGALLDQWQADVGFIRFYSSGVYIVRFQKVPGKVVNGSDIPDCHMLLHPILAYYMNYRYEAEDPENVQGQQWFTEYQTRLDNALSQLQKKRRRTKVSVWT